MRIEILPPLPHRQARLTKSDVAQWLNIGRPAAGRLVDDHWLVPTIDQVAALAGRGTIMADEPIAVVRLGGPGWDRARRIGISPAYEDGELVEAARMWWSGPTDKVVECGHLLVATCGFAIALLKIDGIAERWSTGTVMRTAFHASLVDRVGTLSDQPKTLKDKVSHPLQRALGYRVPAVRGAPLVILPPATGG